MQFNLLSILVLVVSLLGPPLFVYLLGIENLGISFGIGLLSGIVGGLVFVKTSRLI